MAEPSTTASYIFDQAIKLMDEQSDSGQAVWSDTVEYQNRAIAILNALIGECFPYSDTYAVATPGKRPIVQTVSNLNGVVYLDDSLAKTVLPYGLAAELIKNDDPTLGNYFMQRYQELLARHAKTLPAAWDTVEDVYGGIGHFDFARW
jgi:hypothetical protein